MGTIMKAAFLLLLCIVQYVAGDDFLYCEYVIVNSTKTKRHCEAVPSHPVCNVTCVSSSCNRGYEYEFDCSNSTNYKTECPVCYLNTATTCPSDCTVNCEPTNATWSCEDPDYMIIQRPTLVRVCEEPACVESGSTVNTLAVLIIGLLL